MNKLILYLKEREIEEQTDPKVSRWKEIIKIRAETNKVETTKIQRSVKWRASALKR